VRVLWISADRRSVQVLYGGETIELHTSKLHMQPQRTTSHVTWIWIQQIDREPRLPIAVGLLNQVLFSVGVVFSTLQ